MPVPAYNLAPLATMLGLVLPLALVPLGWWALRNRRASGAARLHALALLTLFLTVDLLLFGAFTRLSDSGLGCPDWPGCYGQATPLAAHAQIDQAQAAMPDGPVTPAKAWIEMLHRYLASTVGVLIVLLALATQWLQRQGASTRTAARLAWTALLWVCVQGAFGALTVSSKLYPAVVSLHLLGGYLLLVLLTLLAQASAPQWPRALLPSALRAALALGAAWLLLQAASGAWVSTNYAVLACTEFPLCQGHWVPAMDFARGFEIWHPLGEGADGGNLSLAAITAIHVLHRSLAVLTLLALLALGILLQRYDALRLPARALLGVALLQLGSGLANVVLGWPLPGALLHSAGAGVLLALLVLLLARSRTQAAATSVPTAAAVPAALPVLVSGERTP